MFKIIKKCRVCESGNLSSVFQLKNFPLTGIFLKKNEKSPPNSYDQKLNLCKNCGHIQLNKFISKKKLYDDFYTNRTSTSHISDQSISFLKNFIFKCCKKKNAQFKYTSQDIVIIKFTDNNHIQISYTNRK